LIDKRKFSHINKFNSLPEHVIIIAKYHKWIIYDLNKTGIIDLYCDTQNMRLWLLGVLHKEKIKPVQLPRIKECNFLSIWFECDKILNKDSFKNISSHEFDVKLINGKYTAIELDT